MSERASRLRGVHREFGKGETAVHVLESADLDVKSGELVAIVAPSGAGKSTLLHICGLLERPQPGEVAINGVPTSGLSDRERTMLRRNTIGYVYQFHHLLPEFTALENVVMPQLIAGRSQKDAETRSHALLDLLGVGPACASPAGRTLGRRAAARRHRPRRRQPSARRSSPTSRPATSTRRPATSSSTRWRR